MLINVTVSCVIGWSIKMKEDLGKNDLVLTITQYNEYIYTSEAKLALTETTN